MSLFILSHPVKMCVYVLKSDQEVYSLMFVLLRIFLLRFVLFNQFVFAILETNLVWIYDAFMTLIIGLMIFLIFFCVSHVYNRN